ncbi:MAG TPA: sugar ABC transporter permease [Aquifex aeolicus]|uniref:Sugar ABC transporter permease n=1 Tax=Aquifex aeolicus TaxID=63363 RepID=A0A7C5L484_AQUAO|nr:sugar ABC transporter permease [Aquifex aeolicus]
MKSLRGFLLFSLPAFLLLSTLVLIPVLGTVYLSLFRDVPFLGREFTGADNYLRLLSDSHFHRSLLFTLKFTLLSVPVEVVLGLGVALLVNERIPFRGLLRGAVLLPWAVPAVVSARVWQLMFNYSYGVLNYLSDEFLGFRINWLGTELNALLSLVVADAWRTTPFVAVILLAGLQSIPEDLYSQAKVDGAGTLRRFLYITLPLLKPFILVAILFRGVDALRVFDLAFVLTGGGPGGSTTPLSLYAYRFYLTGDFGYGSAVSVLIFLLSLSLAVLIARVLRPAEALR